MSKAVLLSVQPKWCELIASGKKTVEVRKTKPKLDTPFKVYIYCTKDNFKSIFQDKTYLTHNRQICNGKVIGEFVCDEIIECCSEFYPEEEHPVFEALYRLSEEFDNCWECIASNDNDTSSKFLKETCLTLEDFREYLGNGENEFYAWHISNLVIYDKPKELSEFRKPLECHRGKVRDNCIGCWDCEITRPPQSWCYVEGVSE